MFTSLPYPVVVDEANLVSELKPRKPMHQLELFLDDILAESLMNKIQRYTAFGIRPDCERCFDRRPDAVDSILVPALTHCGISFLYD